MTSSADLPTQSQLEAALAALGGDVVVHGDLLGDGTLPESKWMGNVRSAFVNVEGSWTLSACTLTATTTDPVLGTSGQVLYSLYRRRHNQVDFYLFAKVGTAGFSAGSGTWRFSLPTPAATTGIEASGAGGVEYLCGVAAVTDVSVSSGTSTHARRTGVVEKVIGSNSVQVFFDGFADRRYGPATVSSGAQSANVSHGLGFTPDRVTLTPTGAWSGSGMTEFWADTYGSSTFKANATAAGGNLTGNQTFDWVAYYDNTTCYLSDAYPIPWASGDVIRMWGSYEMGNV